MTIHVDDNLFAIFFLALNPGDQDFMAALSTDPDRPGGILVTYRFRYYGKEWDPFGGGDIKNWEMFGLLLPKEQMIADMRRMTAMLSAKSKGEPVHELIREDGETTDAFVKRFMALPFVHAQESSIS